MTGQRVNEAKKEKELKVLKQALETGAKSSQRETRRIIEAITGEIVERDNAEAPDFLVRASHLRKGGKQAYVAIEHFQVDHFSEKSRKNDNMLAYSPQIEKKVKETQEQGKVAIEKTGDLDKESLDNLFGLLGAVLGKQLETPVQNFVLPLQTSLRKHLNRIEQYRKNCREILKEDDLLEVCFLIEAVSDFSDLYLGGKGQSVRCESGRLVFFEGIVSILEELESKVDYVVVLQHSVPDVNRYWVIALDGNNVRHSLKKQNEPIFELILPTNYIEGIDSLNSDAHVSHTLDRVDGKIEISIEANVNRPDNALVRKLSKHCVFWVDKAKREKKPYATTELVERILYGYGSRIQWRSTKEGWCFPTTTQYTWEEIKQRIEAFGKSDSDSPFEIKARILE